MVFRFPFSYEKWYFLVLLKEVEFVHIGDQTCHCLVIISRPLLQKRAACQILQLLWALGLSPSVGLSIFIGPKNRGLRTALCDRRLWYWPNGKMIGIHRIMRIIIIQVNPVIYSCLDRSTVQFDRSTVQFDHSTVQVDLTVWPFKTLQFGHSKPYSLTIQPFKLTLQFDCSRPYSWPFKTLHI